MRQLSGLDAGFLSLETETAPMAIGSVSILDPEIHGGRLDIEGFRRLLRRRLASTVALRRRLADAEGQLAKIDEEGKTELQKAADRATSAEQKVADLELRALRAEVAAEKGLTPAQAKRLVGATVEELQADADELLASFGPQQNPAGTPAGRPTDRPAAGSSDPTQQPVELDPAKLAESVPRSGLY